jgi:indole-3-glycerol phosphate synthase
MNILDRIIEQKKIEVSNLHEEFTFKDFSQSIHFRSKPLSFNSALTSTNDISIIAEIKKASPSKGVIKPDFNYIEIAELYNISQVGAISVLTDKLFFQGDIEYLNQIAMKKERPLLRKDFIIDEYQVFEARAIGADAVLLISEILSSEQIRDLSQVILDLGMEPLLELHSPAQLDKIDLTINKIIGINNRNLETFSTDLSTSKIISELLPKDITKIAESGIDSKEDLDFLQGCRIDAILVGEYLMRSKNIHESLSNLKKWCKRAS